MILFGHHMKAYFDLEVLGYELTPDTTTEHVIAVGVLALVLGLMLYGAYALVRDWRRWRRAARSRA
jgi:hypothetical protein